jgi:hypothetical protein
MVGAALSATIGRDATDLPIRVHFWGVTTAPGESSPLCRRFECLP